MRHPGLSTGWLLPLLLLALAWSPLGAAEQKGTLVIALDSLGAQTMDPILETRAPHAHYQAPMYDALLGFNIEKGGLGPGVAERWELAKDGLSWTFHIRKGHRWHNGDPVTAHDVKFSLERTMSKESIASRAAALRRDVQRIEVIDDYTVRVYTKGVQVNFPEGLSRATFQEGQLMPKKYIESVGAEAFRKKPIGSGPWKFVKSVPGDFIEYEAVDYPHWRGTPHFKRMILLQVPEESTRVAMVRTGEAAIASISPDSIKEVQSAKLTLVSVPGTMQATYQMYGMYLPEQQKNPLTDKRVREALSLAIDRQQIIDHVMYGEASWPLPFATYRYSLDTDTERWEKWGREALRYDPVRAKQLLAEAGYPDGFELRFANTALPGTPFMVPIGLAVADFWSKIGIKVKYTHYEWGSFGPLLLREQKQLVGAVSMHRTVGRPVAEARFFGAFHSKGAHRLLGRDNACPDLCQAFDKIHREVVTEKDAVKRAEKTNRMIELVSDAWFVVPIIEGKGYWAVNPNKVGAFKPIPGRHEFGDVSERIPRPEQKAWPPVARRGG
ncbi:MAG: ABC transporter substrate-binding protein [Candidatus Lambdaproteobacteria bacterium]|nr:ABC transporter substrate-binding protein [Candidatus Lambdaproteobacteria bacterium]